VNDARKTKAQLISELNDLRCLVAAKNPENNFGIGKDRSESTFLKNSTPMAITTIEDGRYMDVNEAFSKIMGVEREELIGNTSTSIGYISPEHRTTFLNEFTTKGYVENLEMPTRTKNGELRYGLFNSSTIKIQGKDYLLTVVTDITDRKRTEEEKLILEERLYRAEKMEALGTLAGGVAHDLNNVLGIVVGYAELLLMNADKSSSIKTQIENIMKGGQRAAAIVDDLLTLARRGVSGRQIQNLNKIIVETQQLPELKKLHSYHPFVMIKTDLDPDLLNISGSSVHLSKTLFNLISNASEAMPKGGFLTIKTANQYLEKPLPGYDDVREGDYVVLSVSDTGGAYLKPI
jgi:two-component system, cell cycle sensor histidine kinase and response regulator CckA